MKPITPIPLHHLPSHHPKSGELLAIIETPRGSGVKLKYDEELNAFALSNTLAAGMKFPFDFGFIPRTKAPDGDPLDVLVLMDHPVTPGTAVEIRLIGVLEARQTEKDGSAERNDRLIAVAIESVHYREVKHFNDLPDDIQKAIEHFFVSYNHLRGTKFKILARAGPGTAKKCLKKARK